MEDLKKYRVVDFNSYINPGTIEYKPTIRQIKRYVEAKYKKPLPKIFMEAQITFFEIFRDFIELYDYLVNDEKSFLSRISNPILVADMEEALEWTNEEQKEKSNFKIHTPKDDTKYYDGLTGLFNRQKIEGQSKDDFENHKLKKTILCFAMCDIDHFKSFNDQYGHQTGDLVLQIVSQTIKSNLEKECSVGRYGGEEFFIILKKDFTRSLVMLERIRETLAHKKIKIQPDEHQPSTEIFINISIGLTQCEPFEEYEKAVSFADKALYVAKETGRNQVCFFNSEESKAEDPLFTSFGEWAKKVKASQPTQTE
jgi:diguanylate cyclase (GGDEF)-like protein